MERLFDQIRKVIDSFRLKNEREDFEVISSNIDSGVVFKGTNLWILVFAVFIFFSQTEDIHLLLFHIIFFFIGACH